MKNELTWLHLSDWHQGGDEFNRQVVLDALLTDIREHVHDNLEHIDFVAFTGDVAFHGRKDEYQSAAAIFFDPLLQAIGVDRSRLFIVPGNHDKDLSMHEVMPGDLMDKLDTPEKVVAWQEDELRRETLVKPMDAYLRFVDNYLAKADIAKRGFWSVHRLDAGSKQVAVVELNSAWLAGYHLEGGKINDRGFLALGEWQVKQALDAAGDADVVIALMHHPLDWLQESDLNRVKTWLRKRCHFILHGHSHQPELEISTGTAGETFTIPAGACYDRRFPTEPRYANGYNLMRLDFDNGDGVLYRRRWNATRMVWDIDIETASSDDRGKRNFRLPKKLGQVIKPLPVTLSATRVEESPRQLPGAFGSRIRFGADGIRSTVGKGPMTAPLMIALSRALAELLHQREGQPSILIGRDTRVTGPGLARHISSTLVAEGVEVVDTGIFTTPGVAYVAKLLGKDFGIVVSASHSPYYENGVKLFGPDGLKLPREVEEEIERLAEHIANRSSKLSPARAASRWVDGAELIEEYVQGQIERCPIASLKGFSIVLDCAHGATLTTAPLLFSRLGATIVTLNDTFNGMDINHQCGSEYARSHSEEVARMLERTDAAYAFAFDGDGDRLVVVDRQGCVYDGDHFLYVLAAYFKQRNLLRGNTVVLAEVNNKGLDTALRKIGIKAKRTLAGDKNVQHEMWRGDYLLGGEPYGDVILNDDHHTTGDGVFTAMLLCAVMAQEGNVSLRELTAPMQKLPQAIATTRLIITPPVAEMAQVQEEKVRLQEALGKESRVISRYSGIDRGLFKAMVEGVSDSTWEQVSAGAVSLCRAAQAATGSAGLAITLSDGFTGKSFDVS